MLWDRRDVARLGLAIVLGGALFNLSSFATQPAKDKAPVTIRSVRLEITGRVAKEDGKPPVETKGEMLFELPMRWRRTESFQDISVGSCGDGNTAWDWSEHKGTTSYVYRIDVRTLRQEFPPEWLAGEFLMLSLKGVTLVDPQSRRWKYFPHAEAVKSQARFVAKERVGDTETNNYVFADKLRCWFGADDGILRKQVLTLGGKEAGSLLITKVEINPKLDPDLFTYKPSAGVAITDQTDFQAKVLKLSLDGKR